MKRFLLILSLSLFVCGCKCAIHNTTVAQQRPAVKAAFEGSRSAEKNWASYTPDQQKRFIKSNTKSWAALNRVYNPDQ